MKEKVGDGDNVKWLLRPKLMFFDNIDLYYIAIVLDVILRFVWVLSLVPMPSQAQKNSKYSYFDIIYPFLGIIEQMRRAMWGTLRLEWEHIKIAESSRNMEMLKSSGSEPLVTDDTQLPVPPPSPIANPGTKRRLSNFVPYDLVPTKTVSIVAGGPSYLRTTVQLHPASKSYVNFKGAICHTVGSAMFVAFSIVLIWACT